MLNLQVHPGKGLGFLTLGFSLHEILTRLKAQPLVYPSIDISYSPSQPVTAPVVLDLPANGLRLRFDGPEQTLRLIEVLDFTRTIFSYNNVDFVKLPETHGSTSVGPAFRQVYNMMGPTFPGEYLPPTSTSKNGLGTYILSYPGIAFSFPIHDSAWNPERDYVSLLSSSAALPAKSLAVYDGASWHDVRSGLFNSTAHNASSPHKTRDHRVDDVELVKVHGSGKLEMVRRVSPPFSILLGETTPQDLITELGPPDAIHYKDDRRLSIHRTRRQSHQEHQHYEASLGSGSELTETDRSSAHTSSERSDDESDTANPEQKGGSPAAECFYNYFHHGFDIFISCPTTPSPAWPPSLSDDQEWPRRKDPDHLVATKVMLYGNVPGSYPFNRYRRIRWVIDFAEPGSGHPHLHSETPFRSLSQSLQQIWKGNDQTRAKDLSLENPMVINRDWGDSPGNSCELLGDPEEGAVQTKRRNNSTSDGPGPGTTTQFGFPGLVFEVLKNDAVCCLTVY